MLRRNVMFAGAVIVAMTMAMAWAPSAAFGEETQTVQVTGQGIIFGKDKVTARDKAIEDAQRRAVEQVVGTMVSASTMVQNFQVIEDKILTKSKGYVKGYKVLSEKAEDGVMIVQIEASVLLGGVKGDLDAISNLLAQKEYPRVMVLIAEQNIGQAGFSYWWGSTAGSADIGVVENTIIDEWGQKGFRFIDHNVLAGKLTKKDAFKVTSANGLSNNQVEQIANLTDAQLVITGTAVARDVGTVMNTQMHSAQANLSVRIINTDNGEILATSTEHSAAAHIDPLTAGTKALQKVTQKMGEKLLEKVLDKWASSTSVITLDVKGITSYKMLNRFKETLIDELRGVKGVYERRYADGKAEVDVNLQGKISHFATELENKDFEYFTFKVNSKSANKLSITAVAKKK